MRYERSLHWKLHKITEILQKEEGLKSIAITLSLDWKF